MIWAIAFCIAAVGLSLGAFVGYAIGYEHGIDAGVNVSMGVEQESQRIKAKQALLGKARPVGIPGMTEGREP